MGSAAAKGQPMPSPLIGSDQKECCNLPGNDPKPSDWEHDECNCNQGADVFGAALGVIVVFGVVVVATSAAQARERTRPEGSPQPVGLVVGVVAAP